MSGMPSDSYGFPGSPLDPPGVPNSSNSSATVSHDQGRFGLVRNNTIRTGSNQFWLDSVKQFIFENNDVEGVGVMAGGNNIAAYSGGYTQHIFMAGNSFAMSWGNDRESMTFDPACSHYTGPWLTVSASGRNFTTPTLNGSHMASDHFFLKQALGAEVMVMNGTGSYQSRRLLDWGHTAAGGLWWLLDLSLIHI